MGDCGGMVCMGGLVCIGDVEHSGLMCMGDDAQRGDGTQGGWDRGVYFRPATNLDFAS